MRNKQLILRQSLRPRREPANSEFANSKRGAVLLIAILVASVALAVGLGVYNRTYKELLFASFWKQTQVAFASADAGIECALYWQLHPAAQASCFGANIVGWTPGEGIPSPGLNVDTPGGGCVNLRIVWNVPLSATTTEARGYNTSCAVVTAGTNPRIVERGLNVSF